jgi:hypothetical protein
MRAKNFSVTATGTMSRTPRKTTFAATPELDRHTFTFHWQTFLCASPSFYSFFLGGFSSIIDHSHGAAAARCLGARPAIGHRAG